LFQKDHTTEAAFKPNCGIARRHVQSGALGRWSTRLAGASKGLLSREAIYSRIGFPFNHTTVSGAVICTTLVQI